MGFSLAKKIPVPALWLRNEGDMVKVCVSESRPVRRSRADATGLAPKKSASQNPLCVSQVDGLWQRVLLSSRFFWRSLGAEALDHVRRRQPGRFCPASLFGSSWASGLPSGWHPFAFRSAKIRKTSLTNSCRAEIGKSTLVGFDLGSPTTGTTLQNMAMVEEAIQHGSHGRGIA
jgi:hypothetical protein